MATELGQAYVQIMPSAKGIKGTIQKELDPESISAGKSAGGNIVSTLKKVIAGAAIGKFIGSALTEGGNLQQSLGGIETLFKENADKVKQYANEAYMTSGLSANSYMESVTSFSASLLQSLGGDTDKAADRANTALIDMSDNANKMGTDMESIQNAYQGFAKQNYTMLDNLKLGYGGTKTEMERLLADATKLTGVKYDINNLADVYDAIHVIQTELDITGTTAKESAETFSGSLASMKSAFSNVMGNLTLGTDLTPHLQALAKTASTFFFGNFIPMLGNMVTALPGAIVTLVKSSIPYIIEAGRNFASRFGEGFGTGLLDFWVEIQISLTSALNNITENLPAFLNKGAEIAETIAIGILKGASFLVGTVGYITSTFIEFLATNLPMILNSGKDMLLSLVDGIIENLPAMAATATEAVSDFIDAIIENYPRYLKAGWEMIIGLLSGIIERLPKIIEVAGIIIVKFINMLASKIPDIIDMGKNIVKGIWEGIKSMGSWLTGKASDFVDGFVDDVKGFLGIHSPSRVFQDEVGKNIVLGIAKGITENEKTVIKTAGELSRHILSEASKWVDDKKFYNQLSLKNELDFWQDLKNMEGLQGEQLKEIDKKIYTAKTTLQEEENKAVQTLLDEQKKAFDEYQKNIDSRTASLEGFAGLFDKIESGSEVTGKELLENLKSQVGSFKSWQDDLSKLEVKGISESLLSELRELGPKSASEIHALTTLSGAALQEYVTLFEEKSRLAKEQAQLELGEFSFGNIDSSSLASDESLAGLNTTAATVVDTLKTGITTNMFKVSEIASETSQNYILAIQEKISDFENAGRMMTDGLWKGIESGKSGLINNIVKMLEDAVRAAKDAMDINSPSRVWAEIGSFMSQGLGVGFVDEMRSVSRQINNSIPSDAIKVANRSIGMARNGINHVSTTVNDGGVHLHIGQMINSNDRDIHDVSRAMEFYRQQRVVGQGGLV